MTILFISQKDIFRSYLNIRNVRPTPDKYFENATQKLAI